MKSYLVYLIGMVVGILLAMLHWQPAKAQSIPPGIHRIAHIIDANKSITVYKFSGNCWAVTVAYQGVASSGAFPCP